MPSAGMVLSETIKFVRLKPIAYSTAFPPDVAGDFPPHPWSSAQQWGRAQLCCTALLQ